MIVWTYKSVAHLILHPICSVYGKFHIYDFVLIWILALTPIYNNRE